MEPSLSKEKTTNSMLKAAPNQEAIRLKPDGDLVWVEFDLPGEKANKLSSPVLARLQQVIEELSRSQFKVAILVSRKKSIFIAGADIEEIKSLKTREDAVAACQAGQSLFSQLEKLPMTTIAAIHGACVGGGCEMVLACDYRISTNASSTKIGLPEIKLGVIPGFGGTQRLPRLVGLQGALDIILAGKTVPAKKALKLGLVDAMVPEEILEEQAVKMAQEVISGKKTTKRKPKFKPKGFVNSVLESSLGSGVVFSQARKGVLKATKGQYPAPLKALEVVKKTFGSSNHEKGYQIEAEGFGDMSVTNESKSLINLFFLTEDVKKNTGVSGDVKPADVASMGVLGAGTMGGGIAQLGAEKGVAVRLKDLNYDAIGKGLKAAADIFGKSLKRRRIDKYAYARKMNLISGTTDYSGFKTLDVVVEAIVEDMNIKKKVLGELAGHCKDDVILASNTSSLSITEMATGVHKPENFVGMHFFNPVNKMPLIEVIRGEKTGDWAAATIFDLSKKMGKFPIMVKDGPGFLVNRLLMPYLNEACYVLADGASVERIDKALLKFGMPMGPLHLIDEVGIDVSVKVAKILNKAFGERAEAAPLMEKVSGTDKLGRKNNSGFYIYENNIKKVGVDQTIYSILGLASPTDPFKDEEIVHRVLFPMVNEAALCLEEGIVGKPDDVDLGMIMGTGFPPFRGGLLRWADTIGTEKIVDELEVLAQKNGPRFKPSNPLRNMAKTHRTFYQ